MMCSVAALALLPSLCLALASSGAGMMGMGGGRGRARTTTTMATLSPRRALFFEIVESGLADRWAPSAVARVLRFCASAKGELPRPAPLAPLHDPCEEFVEGLSARPWWDAAQFPWTAALESQAAVISSELARVLGDRQLFVGDSRYMNTMGAGWTAFRLQRLGVWNAANVETFPLTAAIVRSLDIPLAVRGVMFAKQAPGSGVKPHSDGRNFILTCHLGLKVPDRCWIAVGGERREWEAGKSMVFDTSFTHETFNGSEDDRYVLIIDFWHPELTADERAALEFVYDARNKFETGKAASIDASYVTSGKTLDATEYANKGKGFGQRVSKGLADFFSDGGLVKFNPFK